MLKNFSIPMSAPNPASVTQKPSSPASESAIWSAMIELFPCAMLANGPQCTKHGVFSMVCINDGITASARRTAHAPATPRSSVVTGSPFLDIATTILPRRSRRSCSADLEGECLISAKAAMISEATAMSKPVRRFAALASVGARLISISRSERSHVSSTLFQVIVSGSISKRAKRSISSSVKSSGLVLSMPSFSKRLSIGGANFRWPGSPGVRRLYSDAKGWVCSCSIRVSIAAATRLFAAVMAWISPVR
mmetsp:Transcript_10771/g.19016  ORF Transcript_10771/g.19016 Transcript_10771/m.19016 type:complete len:250 (+) Transcript_10771:816-1565(+)